MLRRPQLPGPTQGDDGRYNAVVHQQINEQISVEGKTHKYHSHMLHDNSFDGARRWGDGLLFVPDEPRQIRPTEDTGIEVGYNEEGMTCYMSIDPPTERAEYALDYLDVRTGHPLCVACKDVLNYYFQYM